MGDLTSLPAHPYLPHRLGAERSWFWRGWRIRYSYCPPATVAAQHAPPLLLLHGFGASLGQWRDNLVALSQHHPVYALDLLGFGGSQKAGTLLGAHLWAAQVHDFWQQWINQPMILVGHSLGALVALTATTTYPAMVARLVMLTLPAARQELLSGWLEVVSRQMESWFSTPLLIRPLFYFVRQPRIIQAALKSIYRQPDRVDEDLVTQFTQPTLERGAARTLAYLVRSRTDPHFSPATQALISQVQVPILLLWGEEDRVIPPLWGKRLEQLNPQITRVEIPNAGHCLYDEYPQLVNQWIVDWSNPT